MRSFESELTSLKGDALHRSLRPLKGPQMPKILSGTRELHNFSSNDYLGLAASDVVRAMLTDAVRKYGAGSGASRLVCGDLEPHRMLESQLAKLKGTEAAIAFSTGYAAAVGTVSALVRRGDVVILDKLCHASLIDGARLSGATVRVFPHNHLDKLERLLESSMDAAGDDGRVLVVAESVYSMDGDWADLFGIVRLTKAAGALLLLDEAHAFGIFGKDGRGLADKLGLARKVDFHLGTFSKAAGLSGGYVCGSEAGVDIILNRARSFIYSTAPPPAIAAAAHDVITRIFPGAMGERRRSELWNNVRVFTEAIADAGSPLLREPTSAIIPVILGDNERALAAASRLETSGFLVPAIRYPTVPAGQARLRVTLSANHAEGDIIALARAIAKI
ncbi:MAG: 8-amino-7-oxononanoate synthase [Verrucomicrobiae bacterium]|nr:8-amino-7-oxononanoate synthase [Verrucomicrobiae bacterium]